MGDRNRLDLPSSALCWPLGLGLTCGDTRKTHFFGVIDRVPQVGVHQVRDRFASAMSMWLRSRAARRAWRR